MYQLCGWTIIGALVLLFLYFRLDINTTVPVVFILETVAIEAFGLSWITKGQTLWPDGTHYLTTAVHTVRKALG